MKEMAINLKEGIASIRINPLRSFLAILGVVIGVAAVITVVSFGEGHRQRIQIEIDKIGADVFWIQPKRISVNVEETADERRFTSYQPLKYGDVECLKYYGTKINKIAAFSNLFTNISLNSKPLDLNIIATEPSYQKIMKLALVRGRFLSESDLIESRKVCVIEYSDYLKKYLSQRDPLSSSVYFSNINFKVIGLLNKKSESLQPSFRGNIYIPITALKYFYYGNAIETIYCQTERSNIKQALKQAEEILKSRYKGKDLFEAVNVEKLFKSAEKMTRTASLVTAGIAMISLIVGSIGIMNIMLVSVTERTREIGLKKCIGAKNKDIRNQFLLEAILLTSIGGGIGIGLGIFLAQVIGSIIKIPVVFSFLATMIGFFFSVGIGIIAGFYPAFKASRLNPIEALRFE